MPPTPSRPNRTYRVESLHPEGHANPVEHVQAQSPEHVARIIRERGHLATKITEVPPQARRVQLPVAGRAAPGLQVQSPQGVGYHFPVGAADAQAAEDYLKSQGHAVVGGVNLPGRTPQQPAPPPSQPRVAPVAKIGQPVTPFTLIRTTNKAGYPVTSVTHGPPDAAFERLGKKGLEYVSHKPLTVAQAAEAWRKMSDHLKRNKGEPRGGMKRFHVSVRTKSGPRTFRVTAPTAFSALGRLVDAGHTVTHVEPIRPRRMARKGILTRYNRDDLIRAKTAAPRDPVVAAAYADLLDESEDHPHADIVRSQVFNPSEGHGNVWASVQGPRGEYILRSGGRSPNMVHVQWHEPHPDAGEHGVNWGGYVPYERAWKLGEELFGDRSGMPTNDQIIWESALQQLAKTGRPRRLSRKSFATCKYAARKPDAGHAFVSALRRLRSKQQQALHGVAREIAGSLNLNPAVTRDALHDGPGGATPSIAQAVAGGDPETARYAAAWYGLLTRTPALGVFHVAPNGPDSAYKFTMKGSGELVRKQLDRGGISPRVLLPRRDGWDVFVYDQGRRLRDNVRAFAQAHGLKPEESFGKGETLGHADPAEARAKFRQVIMGYENGPRRMARPGRPVRYAANFTLSPGRPGKTLRGEDVMHHDILDHEGQVVGAVGLQPRGEDLHVAFAGFHDKRMGENAGRMGVGDIRAMRRHVLAMYPGMKFFAGTRMSGTRSQLPMSQRKVRREIRRDMARRSSRKTFATRPVRYSRPIELGEYQGFLRKLADDAPPPPEPPPGAGDDWYSGPDAEAAYGNWAASHNAFHRQVLSIMADRFADSGDPREAVVRSHVARLEASPAEDAATAGRVGGIDWDAVTHNHEREYHFGDGTSLGFNTYHLPGGRRNVVEFTAQTGRTGPDGGRLFSPVILTGDLDDRTADDLEGWARANANELWDRGSGGAATVHKLARRPCRKNFATGRKEMGREVNPYVVLYGRKGGRKSKAWISAKIRKLITEEKKPQDQAVAIALHMAGVPKKGS